MHYKTIVLELLQEQYPALHEQLRASRSLLKAMDDYATSLKRHHESWMDRLSITKPQADPLQIASQALELAIQELRDDLPSGLAPSASEEDLFSLDPAMAFARTHTPNA